ncbi:MAG: substrate-binding domain-containing protein [Kiritimatiellae bacterium]|nr:substrate-binding domain-containing protein [Kiritimatiellia bacterium]
MKTDAARTVIVALKMSSIAGQDKLSGIFRYLEDGGSWDLKLIRTRGELTAESVRNAIERKVDGFIVSIPDAGDALDALASSSIPTVVMDIHNHPICERRDRIAFVRNDGEDIGCEAANFLLSQGIFRSFAFIGDVANNSWSRTRGAAFKKELWENGFYCETFEGSGDSDETVRFIKRLKTMHLPCGVFVACDDRAHDVIQACNMANVKIPGQVGILGVDNDTLICEHTNPTLSSLQPDFAEEGYLAARMLDEMMSGKFCETPRTVYCGVKQIVRRQSTMPLSLAGRLVQRAVAYIDRNALTGISVGDVVSHLRVSRRLADLRFRQLQGQSILQAIMDRRLAEVKRLLLTTSESIESISTSCGYSNANSLKNLFKKRYNVSMRDFRKAGGRHQ